MKGYSQLPADGGSQVVKQITAIREKIAHRLSSITHMLAIGSGKGGVGKSTVVRQLALALNSLGYKVGVLDADINGPSQARLGGVQKGLLVPGEKGLHPPFSKEGIPILSLATAFQETEAVDFMSVAKGDSHTWRATKEFSLLTDLLAATDWGELDLLVIDLPPGAERTLQFAEFLGPKTKFVLVSLPSDLARGVVLRSVDALRKTPNEILGLIENMNGYYCGSCQGIRPLFPESRQVALDIPVLGGIPFDPDLAQACDNGERLPESSLPFQRIRELSLKIMHRLNVEEKSDEVSVC